MSSKKIVLIVFIALSLIIGTSCAKQGLKTGESMNQSSSSESDPGITDSNEKIIMYENIDVGLRIFKTPNWSLEEESGNSIPINVTFENSELKAIVTIISQDKSNEEIKGELKTGAGKISIIEETAGYLALQTDKEESIRSDIYIYQTENQTIIATFMSPAEDFESKRAEVQIFKESMDF